MTFQKYSFIFSFIPSEGRAFTIKIENRNDGCLIASLEHVVLHIEATYCARGLLKAEVRSPGNTTSVLFPGRINDRRTDKVDWNAMSVHFWSESVTGMWTVKLSSMNYEQIQGCTGTIAFSNSVEDATFRI